MAVSKAGTSGDVERGFVPRVDVVQGAVSALEEKVQKAIQIAKEAIGNPLWNWMQKRVELPIRWKIIPLSVSYGTLLQLGGLVLSVIASVASLFAASVITSLVLLLIALQILLLVFFLNQWLHDAKSNAIKTTLDAPIAFVEGALGTLKGAFTEHQGEMKQTSERAQQVLGNLEMCSKALSVVKDALNQNGQEAQAKLATFTDALEKVAAELTESARLNSDAFEERKQHYAEFYTTFKRLADDVESKRGEDQRLSAELSDRRAQLSKVSQELETRQAEIAKVNKELQAQTAKLQTASARAIATLDTVAAAASVRAAGAPLPGNSPMEIV